MSAPPVVEGQIIGGKFTIRRERARTAHTATFEAVTAPSRVVELRLIDPSVRGRPDFDDCMQRTMTATNELPSSVALQIVDVGIDNDTGAPFLATELSMTPSLSELVRLCPLSAGEVISFVRSLATALDAAHARGLAHLALSPENVFVGPTPRFTVRLAGFCGRLLLGEAGIDPRCAAPELADNPQVACDVYSVALVTLFALTGEMLVDRSEAALRAPATALAHQTGSPLDARFDAPLARALSTDPEQRFRSVPELAEAVEQAFGVAPPAHTRPSQPRLVADAASSHRDLAFASPEPDARVVGAAFAPGVSAPAPSRRRLVALAGGAIAVALGGIAMIAWSIHARPTERVPLANAPSASSAPVAATTAPSEPAIAPPSPSPSAMPSSPPAVGPSAENDARLTVLCTPECEVIRVDDEVIAATSTMLPAGNHTVTVRRGMHPLQTKEVTLAHGAEEKVSFIFYAPRPPPQKACGKFLQRCD